jgi:hypothetical protein
MLSTITAGISLIDATGLAILGTTLATLALGILANLWLSGRYGAIERDLRGAGNPDHDFRQPVLRNIVGEAMQALSKPGEANLQAIVEERFAADLRGMMFAERFVRGATGLVIILGLLGTFYGLTLSIGRIVQLVAGDAAATADIAQGVSEGLSRALSGMAVAFSNSLVGVFSAVILTVVGIWSNVSDRRTSVMVQVETFLDRALPRPAAAAGPAGQVAGVREAVAALGATVARFEAALDRFAHSAGDFDEFNAHLKDNVQRLSLVFGDLRDTLKQSFGAPRPGPKG